MIGSFFSFIKDIFSSVKKGNSLIDTTTVKQPSNDYLYDSETKIVSNDELILSVLGYKSDKSGIKKLQKDLGLKSDGIIGNKTRTALENLFLKIPKSLENKKFRRFRITHYYVADENEFADKDRVPVLDDNKKIITWVPAAFFASMSLEGTGKLKNGKMLNVSGGNYVSVDSETYEPMNRWYKSHVKLMAKKGRDPRPPGYFGIRYKDEKIVSVQPFHEVKNLGKGWGVIRKIPLEPFKTLASDVGAYKNSDSRFVNLGGLVPRGTRVLILELVGKELSDGSVHDGWCITNDTGGGIFGAHFDLFAGTKKDANLSPINLSIAHIWFEGIEEKIDEDYEYGLYDK